MASPGSLALPGRGAPSALRLRLRAFWRWWRAELLAAMPRRWREFSALTNAGPLVSIVDDAVILREMVAGRPMESGRAEIAALDPGAKHAAVRALLARQRSGSSSVRLCLEPAQYLSKAIKLPLATEENLRAVIGFEMDRNTPFKAEQVYYDFRVASRAAEAGVLVVNLYFAPRPGIDALVSKVESLGVRVASVTALEAVATPGAPVNLLGQAVRANAPTSRMRSLNLALCGLLVLLLGVAVFVPIWQKREAAIALLPKLQKAKADADAVDALRKDLEKFAAENNYVLTRKYANPPVIVLLEDLAHALPDSTWVQQLEIKSGKGREVILTGETASSSKLVETVEQSGSLQNASFRSPVRKGLTPNSDAFVLGADVKTRPLPPPVPEAELGGGAPAGPQAAAPGGSLAPKIPAGPVAPAPSAVPVPAASAAGPALPGSVATPVGAAVPAVPPKVPDAAPKGPAVVPPTGSATQPAPAPNAGKVAPPASIPKS